MLPVDPSGETPPPQTKGSTLIGRSQALKVVQELESLCEVYLKALAVGEPAVLSGEEMALVIERFRHYGKSARSAS